MSYIKTSNCPFTAKHCKWCGELNCSDREEIPTATVLTYNTITMTTEEKAKKYDEALEIAKNVLQTDLHESGVWAIKKIFPELAESEDERIRKFICSIIDNLEPKDFVGVKKMNVLAWLEKQKEPEKLTWKDAQRLYLIWREVSNELDACSKNFPKWSSSTRDMFEEILRRFYEKKGGSK